jgi:methyl-accepting chemotaxis protein
MRDAVERAQQTANDIQRLRAFYSDRIVSKVNKHGAMKAAPVYISDPATIPVPTTFILDFIGSAAGGDLQVKLVSPYPWPSRGDRRLDDFQQEAWDYLRQRRASYLARREQINGREVLRVAIADSMTESCVACHNSNPSSPKKDWKVGDVRGLIEVVQPMSTVLGGAEALSWKLVLGIALSGVLLAAALLAIGLRLVGPLRDLTKTIEGISAGSTGGAIPHASRKDELGVVARALGMLRAQTIERTNLQAGVAREVEARRAQLTTFRELADTFDREVQGLLHNVTQIAGDLKTTAHELTTLASSTEQTAGSSTEHARGFRQAGSEVLTITQDFVRVFETVGLRVADSSKAAEAAVAKTVETSDVVRELSEQAQRIGDVVELIRDIAGQTNLLALNATIEAARAGEAGRGFAVVASEVKLLADRIAKATIEVSGQITEIQAETSNAVGAIAVIGETIQAASASSANLLEQVDHQVRASHSVVGHMQATIDRAEQVSAMLGKILENATAARAGASAVANAVNRMVDTLDSLNHQASQFSQAMKVA